MFKPEVNIASKLFGPSKQQFLNSPLEIIQVDIRVSFASRGICDSVACGVTACAIGRSSVKNTLPERILFTCWVYLESIAQSSRDINYKKID